MVRVRYFCLLAAASLAWPALAAEYAVLANGATLFAERHETAGDTLKLYSNGGYVELPAALVLRFEPDDRPSAKPAASIVAVSEKTPRQLVAEAAERWGLPAELVDLVARAESGYKPDAVSPKGAIGIMQLMPDTARLLGADPNDPRQNVDAGTRYLRALLERYDRSLPKALAAYNAGPGAVDRFGGVPPYRETLDYVQRVVKQYTRTAGR